jgi:hypothetical protein
MQVAAAGKAGGPLGGLDHLRLDLGNEGGGAFRVVKGDEIADLDQILPGSWPNDQTCYAQLLPA